MTRPRPADGAVRHAERRESRDPPDCPLPNMSARCHRIRPVPPYSTKTVGPRSPAVDLRLVGGWCGCRAGGVVRIHATSVGKRNHDRAESTGENPVERSCGLSQSATEPLIVCHSNRPAQVTAHMPGRLTASVTGRCPVTAYFPCVIESCSSGASCRCSLLGT